jgi:hypothetical protein
VPSHFIVLYDELVTDCAEVERQVHSRFAGYRVSDDRECFRIPMKDAIRALQELASGFLVKETALTNRVEILGPLRAKFGDALQPDLISVSIVQLSDVCSCSASCSFPL